MTEIERPRVMIVTAGANQAPLILKARELGYDVLATDGNAGAPALPLADRTAIVDATDFMGLLQVARVYRPRAIVTEQTDAAVAGVAFVADTLGLPGIGYRTAVQTTDKWEMRKACRVAGLPTPEVCLIESAQDGAAAARQIGLPVVVKPVDNQASRGVTKVDDMDAVEAAADRALAASATRRALVEQQMFGAECSVESFVSGDVITVLGISEKIKSKPPFSFDVQLIYPGSFSADERGAIEDFNARVIQAMGIRMGFVHAELILTPKGVRLIEIAARGCGARVITDLLPRLTGIDLLAARLRQAVGEDVLIPEVQRTHVGLLRFFEFQPGTVRGIAGLEDAAAEAGVICLQLTPTIGTVLFTPRSGDQRPGFVLAVAESRDEAVALGDKVMRTVRLDIAPAESGTDAR